MNPTLIHCGICIAIAISLTLTVEAANKSKDSASSVDIVQDVLQSEPQATKATVDRRDLLKPGTRPDLDPKTVWWQAGYTQLGTEWVTFEESVATGGDATLLDEYREQRAILSFRPHGQWKLANWCRKNGLFDQERVHLLRVLIDRDSIANSDAVYERLGCKKVSNTWISPQEFKDASRINAEIEQSHKRWDAKLTTLIQQLEGTPKQRALAEKQLEGIVHPSAVPAIVSNFCTSSQSLAARGVKLLGQIPEYQSTRALAGQAVLSPWKPVRSDAILHLKQRKLTAFAPDLLLLLSNPMQTKLDVAVQQSSPSAQIARFPDLKINWDYVWVDETRDTIRIGIRRLFPVSVPNSIVDVESVMHPALRGTYRLGTDERVNDAARTIASVELATQSEDLDYSADKLNDLRAELNQRIGKVMSECTDQPMSSVPQTWWDWWTAYSSVASPAQKEIVIVDERQSQPNAPSFSAKTIQLSCLVAGTPIWTVRGFMPIEQILPGDRVLSKDVTTGELAYKPVLQTTVRAPTPVQTFRVAEVDIIASLGHHFWVSGEGWTKTRELIPKHPLHTAIGMQRISDIKGEGRVEKVYNLVVADFHTYFVGQSMVLSHDVTTPSLTNVKVPGLAAN